jgi:hypothetical protein
MADVFRLTRGTLPPAMSPPRVAGAVTCSYEDPATVVLQLGKGASGRIFSTHYKIDVRRYMTKRQKEMCE